MNVTRNVDTYNEAFTKNFISLTFGCIIISINGAFVYTYYKSEVFQRDPRYIMYIHLVINDMVMLALSVMLQIMSYTITLSFPSCTLIVMVLLTTTKVSPLNLAGMAVDRYIAVCYPLRHTQICTVRRTYALIAVIWVISFLPVFTDLILLLSQPLPLITSNFICYSSYVFSTPIHKLHKKITQALLFSSVLLTLMVTYLKVICIARSASGSQKVLARNALNTILLHGVQLLLCMFSYMSPVINLILISIKPQERTKILFVTFLFSNVLPRLLSPFIYGVRDKKFNNHIRMHFCRRCFHPVEKKVKVTV
ncbi:odorant receptor 131-2-like [Sphaeramia orbicularis]|uniref:odorant receptor 131-2-like n=1 Tax=Sphaeramia orbicularis TaxID=375764 RepID=UPI00117CBF2C|nr:odorant receptor 131-2-like [Sphaeramia orbicularis]